jgi:hypothetical protein
LVISAGVTIPIFNPNKGDMAKRKLEMIDAEYDFKEAEQYIELDRQILQDKLASLISRYNSLEGRIKELEESNYAQTLSTIKGGDPMMLVQFNQRIIKLNRLLLKIQRDVLLTYVDYLSFTDVLQQQPLRNFLSPSLESIP